MLYFAALPKIPAISPLVAVLIAILLVLIVPPAVFLLRISLHETLPDGSLGPFTLRFYKDLFTGRFFLPSLYNTMIYSFGSALIAIVIGTVQALIVERTNTPGRNLALFGAIISLGVPHILYTVAWLLLLGRSGPLNDLIALITQQPQAINVYSMWGMILIEGIGFVPLTFLLMSAVFRSMDASFEEAAIVAGASPLRAFWEVTIGMGVPAICALAMLIFIRTFKIVRGPGAGWTGRQYQRPDDHDLSKRPPYRSHELRRVGRLCHLPRPDRDGVAHLAEQSRAQRPSLPDYHRQGLPAPHRRSRWMAVSLRQRCLSCFFCS